MKPNQLTPEQQKDLSNEDMVALALMSLAPALVGGAMGGKQGALGGGAAGLGAVGGVFQHKANEQSKAKQMADAAELADKKRKQGLDDSKSLIDYRNNSKPTKAPEVKTRDYEDENGNTRMGVVEGGKLIKTPDDQVVKNNKPPKDLTVQERNTLQKQYDMDPEVKKVKEVFSSYQNVMSIEKAPQTPTSDHSLVFMYMKAMDPGSVVRETEFESAKALGALSESAKAWINSKAGGGLLSAHQRQELIDQVKLLAKGQAERMDGINAQFSDLATRRKVPTEELRFINRPEFGGDKPKSITVSNGKETLVIPAEDLADAEADGYKAVN